MGGALAVDCRAGYAEQRDPDRREDIAMDLLFPDSQLDCHPLAEFLQQSKAEQWRHERIIMDAGNAVCRYKQIQDRECAKFQIEDFLDAAERLMKTIQPIGGTKYMQRSISQSIPRGIYAQQPAPLRALETLPVALDILCESARETLNSLTPYAVQNAF